MLPLIRDEKASHAAGWCTYVSQFDSPEIEVLCGGLNSKTPTAAAVWRQGNLLHFGFDLSPAEMNDTGKGLLVNSIAYIARFTEDRPIPRTPSPFEGTSAMIRPKERLVARIAMDKSWIEGYFAPKLHAELKALDADGFRKWLQENHTYLHAESETGKLVVDAEAKAFGTPPNTPEFFDKAIGALRTPGDQAERARRLLRRYVPDGPGEAASDDWRKWVQENRPYLFFSDCGWYRWYIDPLAKKRGVPSAQLRGPDRADVRR